MINTMIFAALLFCAMVIVGGVLIGFSDTLYERALYRWGRYELRWTFDRPFPGPKRFWTRGGALRYLHQIPQDSDKDEETFYIVDRKTKEEYY